LNGGIFNNIIMDRYKKLLWLIFKENTEGCDIYHNHGSIWLILTDERKWVFELTKEGTLWYNYYFFKDCFRLLSLDVKENQKYITDWVVEKIQNGVKHTDACQIGTSTFIEDAIENGVKDTRWGTNQRKNPIEDTIQNGVKDTFLVEGTRNRIVEDTIHNGVKKTFGQKMNPILLGDIIKNGINETHDDSYHHKGRVEGIINNRVKETNPHFLEIINPINFEPVIKEMKRMNEVNVVLENGIKETTPGGYLGSVEMKGKTVHQFEHSKQDNDVEDVIESGIKETKYCELHSLMRADHIIRDGIKETHWRRVDNHPTYLDNIIK
jgi:hypothetical protein